MSQNDLSIANQGFPAFRSDLNSALQALGSTNSGTSAPSTTYANQLWYDTTNNILYIRNEDNDAWIKLFTLDQTNDNVESLHTDTIAEATSGSGVTIDSVTLKDGELGTTASPVPINSSSLNGGQFSGRNAIINGCMSIAQRSTSLTVGASTEYKTLDRFAIAINGTTAGRATMSQSTDVPTGFRKSMKFDVTTADTSIGSGEAFGFTHRIEGQNIQHFKKGTSDAEELKLSFYVKGTAKTFIAEIRDDNSRFFSKTFSVTSSWNRVTIDIPADTTGTIDNDNTTGMQVLIWLHAGSDYTSGTLGTSWATSVNANRMVGCESIFSSTSNEFFITGMQLETTAVTSFEHLSFSQTLDLCQSYFQKSYNYGDAIANTSDTKGSNTFNIDDNSIQRDGVRLTKTMRADPTIVVYNPTTGASGSARTNAAANISTSIFQTGENGFFVDYTPSSGEFLRFHHTAEAEL